MSVHPIDLRLLDLEGAISTYLILGGEPALVDPGPSTTLATLRAELAERGVRLDQLRHLFLTHVHLDHAGAAGHLVAENPRLLVHVHRDGAPHLADPTKLVASTRRTFGERHDALWGETRPVRPDAIRTWEPRSRGIALGGTRLRAAPTPGHIGHHLAYLHEEDGTLLSGDALGIVLAPGAPTHPATPPPSVDLEAWRTTLAEVRAIGPVRLGVAHFGLHPGVGERTDQLEQALAALEARVREGIASGREEEDAKAFAEEARAALGRWLPRERADRHFDVFDPAVDWRGVERYVRTSARGQPAEG